MKKLINSIKNKINGMAISAKASIASKSGEGYIDTGVKNLITVISLLRGDLSPRRTIYRKIYQERKSHVYE